MFIKELFESKIYNRSLVILPSFENKTFSIYNGKSFIQIKITNEMIGKKFGEFVFTKKRPVFKSKKNLKSKKK